MPIDVKLDIHRTFQVPAKPNRVFDVLADVPESVSHYPEVASLTDVGDGAYRWIMEEVGLPGFGHTVVYACRYAVNSKAGTVTWTPVAEVGNGVIAGAWQIAGNDAGTAIDFRTTGSLAIPGPALLGGAVKAIAMSTFERQVDEYIANLRETFGSS